MTVTAQWILFFQTPYDNDMVKYITNELNEGTHLHYYKFLKYLRKNFVVDNFMELKKELNRFKTIYLDCQTGQWEIKQPEINMDVSFDDLAELNPDKLILKDKRGEPQQEGISIPTAKKYINNYSTNKKDGKQPKRRGYQGAWGSCSLFGF